MTSSGTSSPPVITRFAPSPTGHLHIGGARTALFCWAFARRNAGHFVLRIEDTDQARSSDESARGIMDDLAWLGIDWDEGPVHTHAGRTIGGDPRGVGPFFQARRVELYNSHIRRLVETGQAYPAFESPEEIELQRRAAVAAKQTYRYNRAALEQAATPAERLRRMDAGEPHVIRLLAPPGEVVVQDQVLGDVRYAPGELDDFVLRKADGFPTYHFAVVIDDFSMGVTHVLRAQEHLNNTPRHVALQWALGFPTPAYAHMPLIFNPDSSKMSKRDKAKAARAAAKQAIQKDPSLGQRLPEETGLPASAIADFLAAESDSVETAAALATRFGVALPEVEVSDFRENGYTPEAICNFLGLLGWNPGMKLPDGKDLEKFDREFLASNFSLERIGRTNAKFDRVKLASFNADTLVAMPDEMFAQRWLAWAEAFAPPLAERIRVRGIARVLARVVKPRAKTFRDTMKPLAFLLESDAGIEFDAAAMVKHVVGDSGAGAAILTRVRAALAAMTGFEPSEIASALEAVAASAGVAIGTVSQPVRVALTGSGVSPPLAESLFALGRESALARIDQCLAAARAASVPSQC